MENEKESCVACGSEDIYCNEKEGNWVCTKCGSVIGPYISEGRDWSIYENEEGKSESARAEKVDDEFHTLGTDISLPNGGNFSTSSRILESASRRANAILNKENKTILYLKESYNMINDLSYQLDIPEAISKIAKEIVKTFEEKKGLRNYRKPSFMAAVLCIACKRVEGGRTIKNICNMLGSLDEREMKRYYKMIINDRVSFPMINSEIQQPKQQVMSLIDPICTKLGCPRIVSNDARIVAQAAVDFLEGKHPASIAAASIAFVLEQQQRPFKNLDLAHVAGISLNTLRSVTKMLADKISDYINPSAVTHRPVPVVRST